MRHAVAPLFAAAMIVPVTIGAAQNGSMLDGLPGVQLLYYDVAGIDTATIQASLAKYRPTDPADGVRVDALTRSHIRWSWPVRGDTCDLAAATVTIDATVQLPRLANRPILPADLIARWDAYIVTLEAHEAQHVRNSVEARGPLLAAIHAATCATAAAAAKAVLDTVQRRDAELDRTTNHGRTAQPTL